MALEQQPAREDQLALERNLQLMREGLRTPYRGYPDQTNRLVMPYEDLERTADGRIILPAGLWDVAEHPEGIDTTREVSAEEQARLADAGLELDSAGRPLHPWFARMIADPLIGVVINKGALWEWGPAPTASAVIQKNNHIVLVQREDTGQLSIPGGFVDKGETCKKAMAREVFEECGLVLPENACITPMYSGLVADIRLTAHAWPRDTTFLVKLPDGGPLPELIAGDDAAKALWLPDQQVRNGSLELFGAHRFLAQLALS